MTNYLLANFFHNIDVIIIYKLHSFILNIDTEKANLIQKNFLDLSRLYTKIPKAFNYLNNPEQLDKSSIDDLFGIPLEDDDIQEYKLKWVNVCDPYYKSGFRNYYDIYSTPVIYLLDKNKKIIAKRLSPEQLEDLIRHKLGIKGDDGRILEKPENVKEEEHEDEH